MHIRRQRGGKRIVIVTDEGDVITSLPVKEFGSPYNKGAQRAGGRLL